MSCHEVLEGIALNITHLEYHRKNVLLYVLPNHYDYYDSTCFPVIALRTY
jgi:hypothetical protein